jgi:hypothetical protein
MLVLAGLTALVAGVIAASAAVSGASAGSPTWSLALDADASNGSAPCNPIDEQVEVSTGDEFKVGICIVNAPIEVSAFDIVVEYDGNIMQAPDLPEDVGGLDQNPDANAGDTTFGSTSLGDGWDCTSFTVVYPTGDDKNTADVTDARLVCNAALVDAPDIRLKGTGPVGVITFNATGQGAARLDFSAGTQMGLDPGTTTIGQCAEVASAQLIECRGAAAYVGVGAGTPVPTRTVSAPTAEALATQTAVLSQRATAIAQGTPAAALETPGSDATAPADQTAGAGATVSSGDATATAAATRAPAGTRTAIAAGGSQSDGGDGGSSAGLIIAIVVIVAAVAFAGGGYAYWRMRMRRTA